MRIKKRILKRNGKTAGAVCRGAERKNEEYLAEANGADGDMGREHREKRNRLIKREVQKLIEDGLTFKEARYVVAEKYFLSAEQVKRIYYETRED